jgi:hypothetical protein
MTIPFLAVLLSLLDGSEMHIYIDQMSRPQETVSMFYMCGRGVHFVHHSKTSGDKGQWPLHGVIPPSLSTISTNTVYQNLVV